jgi:hypothetical protein
MDETSETPDEGTMGDSESNSQWVDTTSDERTKARLLKRGRTGDVGREERRWIGISRG